jgi:hypothetical protein
MRYDVAVAGGGTAGCVLSARLSEDPGGRSVSSRAARTTGRTPRGEAGEKSLEIRHELRHAVRLALRRICSGRTGPADAEERNRHGGDQLPEPHPFASLA